MNGIAPGATRTGTLESVLTPDIETWPDAAASDPVALGWMRGFPPPEDRIVRFHDGSYFRFPALRWTVCNFRELMPTVNVPRGAGAPFPLPESLRDDIDHLRFTPLGSEDSMTWRESLDANYTDGILVLHRGRIVYERYFGALQPGGLHGCMSVTKWFVGTLAALLVATGELDPRRRVADYVPELQNSGFGDATVCQVMDMTTGIRFREDYTDPDAEIWAHTAAGNPLPKPADYAGPRTYYEFLETVAHEGRHGDAFAYKTANTDVLAWILARATDRSIADLLAERIWSRLGAEHDAYMSVDSIGTPFAGGGLSTSLRDLARFGEMLRNDGRLGDSQILPRDAVADIRGGGDPAKFAMALHAPRRLELPRHVVAHRRSPRRVHGTRRPWPGALHRPDGRDGDRPLRVVPHGRECGHRSDVAARLSSSGGTSAGRSAVTAAGTTRDRAPSRPDRFSGRIVVLGSPRPDRIGAAFRRHRRAPAPSHALELPLRRPAPLPPGRWRAVPAGHEAAPSPHRHLPLRDDRTVGRTDPHRDPLQQAPRSQALPGRPRRAPPRRAVPGRLAVLRL